MPLEGEVLGRRLDQLTIAHEVVVRGDAVDIRLRHDEPIRDTWAGLLERPARLTFRAVMETSPLRHDRWLQATDPRRFTSCAERDVPYLAVAAASRRSAP